MQPSRVNTLLKHIIIIIIRTSCILNKFDMRPDKKICDIYNKRIQSDSNSGTCSACL